MQVQHRVQMNSDDGEKKCHGPNEGRPKHKEYQQRLPYLQAIAKCVVILAGGDQLWPPNVDDLG